MKYFDQHIGRSQLVTTCTWSLQRVAPEQMSQHHSNMALCPICNSMTFVATEEELIENLTRDKRAAERSLATATNTLEIFRQRVAELRLLK